MTQGKIERWHQTLKNVVNLEHYYFPGELEEAIAKFVDLYNNDRYHESLDNLTPADVYFGRAEKILSRREKIKEETVKNRRKFNLNQSSKNRIPMIVENTGISP